MLHLLFCCDPLAAARSDPVFAAEIAGASAAGLGWSLVDHEALEREYDLPRALRRLGALPQGPVLYRGWMLRAEAYEALVAGLEVRGLVPVTSPSQYRFAHHFPNAYPALAGFMAEASWIEPPFTDEVMAAALARHGDVPLVIKDWVKSQAAGYWQSACFIPNAADRPAALAVLQRFLELQGAALVGGIVFRRHLPLTGEEWRAFLAKGRVIALAPRGSDPGAPPPASLLAEVAAAVPCPFFTADFARRQNGGWLLVEIGDGQVSSLPASVKPEQFYAALKPAFAEVG